MSLKDSMESDIEVVPFDEDQKQSQSDPEDNSGEGTVKRTKVCLIWVRILFQPKI